MMNPFAKLFRARDKPRDAVSDAPNIFSALRALERASHPRRRCA